ncbi:rhomboid family intramembrane serine protease [Fundidesulfovibrio butyratiphilus]
MIPLKDNIPRIHHPLVVWAIFFCNLAAFLFEEVLPQDQLSTLIQLYGVVPARLLDAQYAARAGYPAGGLDTLITYMFLHGGWMHFLLNMWVFWIFADNVEDALGKVRFVVFYLTCGVLAAGLHVLFNPGSTTPVVGASGAIAGVMGGYFRLFPHARVVVLVPIIIIPWIIEVPSLVFLGIWFLIQILSGLTDTGDGGGVAWWAHVGGFLCGLALVRFLGARDCRYCYLPENRSYRRL